MLTIRFPLAFVIRWAGVGEWRGRAGRGVPGRIGRYSEIGKCWTRFELAIDILTCIYFVFSWEFTECKEIVGQNSVILSVCRLKSRRRSLYGLCMVRIVLCRVQVVSDNF